MHIRKQLLGQRSHLHLFFIVDKTVNRAGQRDRFKLFILVDQLDFTPKRDIEFAGANGIIDDDRPAMIAILAELESCRIGKLEIALPDQKWSPGSQRCRFRIRDT